MGRGSLELVVSDGVAFAHGGDTMVIVYASPASLQRTRWMFDRVDERAARHAQLNGLMIMLSTADAPDAETRAENTRRMARLRGKLRHVVTVIIGDSVRTSLVRGFMRAMFLLQGLSKVQQIVCSVEDGLQRLVGDPTPLMPTREQLDATLREISIQLSCSLE